MVKTRRKSKKIKEENEVIHKVQFRISHDWISLVCDPTLADKPNIGELHSICKHTIVLLEKLTGYHVTDILTQIHKDIKDNVKDRHKMLVEDWPENQVKNMYKLKNETFKRYK